MVRRHEGPTTISAAIAAELMVLLREQAPPAERACGVREEPGVDAVHVEGMAAFGQEPQAILCFELAQADRTVRAFFQAFLHRVVEEDGQGVDEGLVHACVVEMEELLELSLQSGDGDDGAGISAWMVVPHDQASDEKMEASGEEEDDGEDDDDDNDARVDLSFSEGLVQDMASQA